uniref:Uncharacterized protein n=1 Tax=Helicotheca tamesis TaxID=374047 RepID=A0A7S2MIC7_9STRA|mmetsp:Transcript_16619/g.22777  ORF Transcript_16619/g.22777 Transcript_16619/m.22777 type:complete len:130 (+) Transcript_16619:678-1067(+)
MLFLLEKWPEVIKERDKSSQTPLDIYEKNYRRNTENDADVKKVFTYVYKLFDDASIDNDCLKEMVDYFISIQWWNGVLLLLDRHPLLKKQMEVDTKVFPNFLSVVGQRCNMKTMWLIISNELDIMEGVH